VTYALFAFLDTHFENGETFTEIKTC